MTSVLSGIASILAAAGVVFANVEVGSMLPNPTIAGADGVQRTLIHPDKVTAFVFFDPQHERSQEVLRDLAELQTKLAEADIHWVGVVSDRFSPESVAAALEAGAAELEIITDFGDRLYGALGVRLYPSIGIADTEATLRAYLPYAKVNYMGAVEAHLRHTMGEIDDAELERALHPTSVDVGTQSAAVGRSLKLARMLWDSGKRDKALARAQLAAESAPDLAEPHALVGTFLAEEGRCEEARPSLERALEIDPDHAGAKAALSACDS